MNATRYSDIVIPSLRPNVRVYSHYGIVWKNG